MNTIGNVSQIDQLQIKLVAVEQLTPYIRNSRTHSTEQIDLICASIKEFGWTSPCLIADGQMIAGHGRLSAAKKLGLLRVPCIDLSHLTVAQRRAYVITDNQLPNFGTSWDMEMLKLELSDLKLEGFDLDLLGFGDALADLLGQSLALRLHRRIGIQKGRNGQHQFLVCVSPVQQKLKH